MDDHRADHPSDESVTRARGDAEVPGDHVPEDGAGQSGEDHRDGHRVLVDDPLGDDGSDRERHAVENRQRAETLGDVFKRYDRHSFSFRATGSTATAGSTARKR